MLAGHATAEGTARYRERFPNLRDAGHFRRPEQVPGADQIWLSSIGLGTYLGEPSDAADQIYTESIAAALRSGVRVVVRDLPLASSHGVLLMFCVTVVYGWISTPCRSAARA